MNLACDIPESVMRHLREALGEDVCLRFSLESDVTRRRRFGRSYVVLTDTHLAIADETGPPLVLALSDIEEVSIDELFGSGRLVAKGHDGSQTPLIYYTRVVVPDFAVMCRTINALIQGREPDLPDGHEHSRCPKCGMPLPERGETCPRCVSRFTVFGRLLVLVRPYSARALLLLTLTALAVGFQMVTPYLLRVLVDDVIRGKEHDLLVPVALAMFGAVAFLTVTRFLGGVIGAWLAVRVVTDLRSRLHTHLQRLQLSFFTRRDSGQIVARVAHDTGELQHFLSDGLPYLLINTVLFFGIAGTLLYLDWRLALLVFLPVPFLFGGGAWFARRLMFLFHKFASFRGAMHSILGESIHGIRPVKAYVQEGRRSQQFDRIGESLFHSRFRIERTWIGFSEAMSWVMGVGLVAVWYFGAGRLAAETSGDELTLGKLFMFAGLVNLFYTPLRMYAMILNWMTHAMASLERIFGMLDAEPEIYDSPEALALPKVRGDIRFDDVRFSYERGKEIIKGVSFEIAPGEMIGLVGKSGAGKSTLINLICRFYDIDSGELTIDGHPVSDVRMSDLRGQIGMVMQEPFLFNATILDNIRAGAPSASFHDVVRAARAAHAHEFIIGREDGYDSVVGEGGASLSGGEKQRIAIARAILHDPPILILDEATSSVDTETESAIQAAIGNLVKNRTTIAIAHRLGTLRHADRLFVVEEGKIAEIGTHEELVEGDGIYAKLVRMQTDLNDLAGNVWRE